MPCITTMKQATGWAYVLHSKLRETNTVVAWDDKPRRRPARNSEHQWTTDQVTSPNERPRIEPFDLFQTLSCGCCVAPTSTSCRRTLTQSWSFITRNYCPSLSISCLRILQLSNSQLSPPLALLALFLFPTWLVGLQGQVGWVSGFVTFLYWTFVPVLHGFLGELGWCVDVSWCFCGWAGLMNPSSALWEFPCLPRLQCQMRPANQENKTRAWATCFYILSNPLPVGTKK